jgi:hypothetical protein
MWQICQYYEEVVQKLRTDSLLYGRTASCKGGSESVHCTVLASRRLYNFLYSLAAPLLRLTEIIYIRLDDPLHEIKSSNVFLKEECGGCDTFSGRIHSTSHCPPPGKI